MNLTSEQWTKVAVALGQRETSNEWTQGLTARESEAAEWCMREREDSVGAADLAWKMAHQRQEVEQDMAREREEAAHENGAVAPAPAWAMIPNGHFTIRNKETNEHRTFRVRTQKADAKFAAGERIVSLLVGPENTGDYKGFGFVGGALGREGVRVWRKCQGTPGAPSAFDKFARLLEDLFIQGGRKWGSVYDLQESRTCLRCNRLLTEPESLASGYGPECRSILGITVPPLQGAES